jgi:hypothetical protein
MRSVSASLEPLSSPSPSPSPPPPETAERAVSQPTTAGGVGLDSGSELSELTEEEQDNENHSNDENDEELDEGEEEEEAEGTRRQPVRRGGGRRKRGGMVPAPMWDWAYKQKKGMERGTTAPEEEEEEEEQPSPPKAMEEEEDEEEEGSRHTSGHPSINDNAGEDEDQKDEEDEPWCADHADSERGKKIRRPMHIFPQKAAPHKAVYHDLHADSEDSDEEEDEEDEDPDVEEDGDVPQLNLDPTDPANDSDSDPDLDVHPTESATVPNIVPMDVDIDGNVDITAPSPATVPPIVAAAAALSIMAGSSILASATPSPDSSLSGSPASSRSASPIQEKADQEDEDQEDDGNGTTHDRKRVGKKQLSRDDEDTGPLASATSTVDGVKPKLFSKDAEAEDLEVASVIHDDLDLEIDADLQPAHRAEALDVLATIELKFALLRERVYVEKMEGLAWEEALVADGTYLIGFVVSELPCLTFSLVGSPLYYRHAP